jgi:putative ATPase
MLFTDSPQQAPTAPPAHVQPLAARLRPRSFDEYVGQGHIIGPGKLLRRAIAGTGKTTLAELVASLTESHFERLSAVTASVADIRRCVKEAVARQRLRDNRTILFVDEIHRFNKTQQDALLPHVEDGTVRLIGATTENPFFHVVGPLLSRAQLFQLQALAEDDIRQVLARAASDERAFPDLDVRIDDDAAAFWAQACEGDARRALTAFEVGVLTTAADAEGVVRLTIEIAQESLQQKAVVYGDDGHYDTASAFIKSMRGSDPDAAIYWLATMLEAGEDIRFIARRIVIFAAEDIGNADPRALTLATSTMQAVQMVGMPEARIILSQAVTYCATAPKSNASLTAVDKALADVRNNRVQPVPVEIRDSHFAGAKALGSGAGYDYPHDNASGLSKHGYMSVPKTYYSPHESGYEIRIRERLDYWRAERTRIADDGQ